jgi:hypothetical protein
MRFIVKRTSEWNGAVQPCEGAEYISPKPDMWDGEWAIEIADINALMEFVVTHGRCIVSVPFDIDVAHNDTRPHLEIYDDYRE